MPSAPLLYSPLLYDEDTLDSNNLSIPLRMSLWSKNNMCSDFEIRNPGVTNREIHSLLIRNIWTFGPSCGMQAIQEIKAYCFELNEVCQVEVAGGGCMWKCYVNCILFTSGSLLLSSTLPWDCPVSKCPQINPMFHLLALGLFDLLNLVPSLLKLIGVRHHTCLATSAKKNIKKAMTLTVQCVEH